MEEDIVSLLARVARDESAFGEVAERYSALVNGAAQRFLPSFEKEDAAVGFEDLLQSARLALYRAALSYDAGGQGKSVSFGLYAKICVNNALVSLLRKERCGKRKRSASVLAGDSVRTAQDPFVALTETARDREILSMCRRVLSPYEERVFDEYISGKSVREIAECVGKEERSVSNALYRMKAKIKGLLKENHVFIPERD